MITDLFDDIKPTFISMKDSNFFIAGRSYEKIEAIIQNVSSVRKLFNGNRVECYSNNAKIGKNGQYCAICSKRLQCQRRIRLMLIVQNYGNEQLPAQLEINKNSFAPLKEMLESIDVNELNKTLIAMSIKKNGRYLQVQFSPLF
jgi:hypothetical protein